MSLAGGDQTMLKLQNEIKETEHIKRSNNVSINEGSSPKTSTALKSSAVQEAISNMESHCKGNKFSFGVPMNVRILF